MLESRFGERIVFGMRNEVQMHDVWEIKDTSNKEHARGREKNVREPNRNATTGMTYALWSDHPGPV